MPVRFTDEEIIAAADNAYTVHGLCLNLGIHGTGANHRIYKRIVAELGIVFRVAPPSNPGPMRPLCEYLVYDGPQINTSKLRQRLVKEGVLPNECTRCHIGPIWLDQPLSLHLDHIDGDRKNCTIENLRILCPNCHSQTPTYGALKTHRVIKPCKRKISERKATTTCARFCSVCAVRISRKSKLGVCAKCYQRPRKVHERPSPEELQNLLSSHSFKAVARKFGVSDNCIRKWLS